MPRRELLTPAEPETLLVICAQTHTRQVRSDQAATCHHFGSTERTCECA
jgi:hypothetical protein